VPVGSGEKIYIGPMPLQIEQSQGGSAEIVQEEYSTTSHVAVITGYDEALGTFIAQDPATHQPLSKSFEWTQRSGDLFVWHAECACRG
jgi:hypothetical protein